MEPAHHLSDGTKAFLLIAAGAALFALLWWLVARFVGPVRHDPSDPAPDSNHPGDHFPDGGGRG